MEKVRLAVLRAPLLPGEPVGVGDRCFGDRLQKCLLARWAFEPGDVLFHERCAVVVMDVGAVPLTANHGA